ncbi:hypothetical protein LWC34_26870 [Kibdelosporangium philippinense]|uniref:Uncharacterized protein n=1 Tax=Kibdelosporangium philippinense TaxID=211113 RepID=A0ABS8ZF31_9PSEU|nr:hypothetical protein [Kibdelosporangium philippinense]MCE7006424.1 hypothetical protein [Kibdelosporangium philippinense]
MTATDEFERRLCNVEERTTAALVLAREVDKDVSVYTERLLAQTKVIEALRETQVEQGKQLNLLETKVDKGFARMDEKFAEIDANFTQIDANFAKVQEQFAIQAMGQAKITELLDQLIDKDK